MHYAVAEAILTNHKKHFLLYISILVLLAFKNVQRSNLLLMNTEEFITVCGMSAATHARARTNPMK